MPNAEEAFEALAQALTAHPGVRRKPMFGNPSLFVKGKMFMGVYQDELVFKLSGAALSEALALPGAHPFDPGGQGRLMKAWACVPEAHAARWEDLANAALAYVAGLTPG